MTDQKKIDELIQLFRSLDDNDKQDFVGRILEDENLMRMLLDALIASGEGSGAGELNEARQFVDFLRKVKE